MSQYFDCALPRNGTLGLFTGRAHNHDASFDESSNHGVLLFKRQDAAVGAHCPTRSLKLVYWLTAPTSASLIRLANRRIHNAKLPEFQILTLYIVHCIDLLRPTNRISPVPGSAGKSAAMQARVVALFAGLRPMACDCSPPMRTPLW